MKYPKRLLLTAFLMTIGLTATANAQLMAGASMKVNVPFSFVVGDRMFAPGSYSIARTRYAGPPDLFIFRGRDKGNIILNTMGSRSHTPSKVSGFVFDQVGGTYYLTSILFKGQTYHNDVRMSSAQRELIARGRTGGRLVTVMDTGP